MADRSGAHEVEWSPPADRERWGPAEGEAMAAALRRSGLTADEFAERHGIGVWRVRRWSRGRPTAARKDAVALLKRSSVVRFAPVRIAESGMAASVDVVVGRAVVRVGRDFDAELLRRVVLALGEVPC